MKEKMQAFGGFLALSIVLSCIAFVWSEDRIFWLKIISTQVLLVVLILMLDKAASKDETP